MKSCNHLHLVLLSKKVSRLRCQHCHLTIDVDELQNRYCPECFDVSGKKYYDFETVLDKKAELTQYQCEECGEIIRCD